MKRFLLCLLVITSASLTLQAKIRRVGFFGSPITNTDYVSFTAAYTAAAAGDTILVFPNNSVSGILTKKLFIFGPGCWLDPAGTPRGNANQQAFPGTATISSLTFNDGSQNSVVMGFNSGTIYINTDSITIRRNRELDIYVTYNSPAKTTTNLQVLQNYRVSLSNYYTNASSCTNMNISNNLITFMTFGSGNTYSGLIANNVWAYDNTQSTNNLNGGTSTLSNTNSIELGAGSFILQNNIFCSYTNAAAGSNYNYYQFSNAGNSVFNNNLALQAGSGPAQTWGVAGTGNVITPIANAANIFNAWPLIGSASADARYQLKAGSPALTTGAGGTPIGMFAGNYPYKLSGLPSIPSIYLLSSPQGNNPPGNTLQINVSTKGNN